jgi:hypothetical protein
VICLVGANVVALFRVRDLGQGWNDWLDESRVPRFPRSLYGKGIGGRHSFVRPGIAIGAPVTDDLCEGGLRLV